MSDMNLSGFTYLGSTDKFKVYWNEQSGVKNPEFLLVYSLDKVGVTSLESLKSMKPSFKDLKPNVWFGRE